MNKKDNRRAPGGGGAEEVLVCVRRNNNGLFFTSERRPFAFWLYTCRGFSRYLNFLSTLEEETRASEQDCVT
ncbi:hypothetical protein EYF80_047880 [Liparis tanakae]|uniref:Uncharacterized protein n=1 Tax=Liparis tanakae TaxID=230148 RepID=A0A4Z2FLC0_9TELE|nr:hypothetical protein EYF80_047880 [Liparis tanakae]